MTSSRVRVTIGFVFGCYEYACKTSADMCQWQIDSETSLHYACTRTVWGNGLDKLCHTRCVAYSAELVLLNKQQISAGGAYPDCNPVWHAQTATKHSVSFFHW